MQVRHRDCANCERRHSCTNARPIPIRRVKCSDVAQCAWDTRGNSHAVASSEAGQGLQAGPPADALVCENALVLCQNPISGRQAVGRIHAIHNVRFPVDLDHVPHMILHNATIFLWPALYNFGLFRGHDAVQHRTLRDFQRVAEELKQQGSVTADTSTLPLPRTTDQGANGKVLRRRCCLINSAFQPRLNSHRFRRWTSKSRLHFLGDHLNTLRDCEALRLARAQAGPHPAHEFAERAVHGAVEEQNLPTEARTEAIFELVIEIQDLVVEEAPRRRMFLKFSEELWGLLEQLVGPLLPR
mmetsp:Transcript_176873/g.567323  ORF Transcript_176873/g.567323 Transcript_176873/m.567323 type:complete len:299 (-) Transcript_176873:902-1798(-)